MGMLDKKSNWESLKWDATKNGQIDIRLFYGSTREPNDWKSCRFDPGDKDLPNFYKVSGITNSFGNFGLFSETALVAILLYIPFLNVALGTRQIPFAHFAVPSFSFFVAIFFYDELRKIWLRSGMVRENGRLKLKGWIVQNTYY